MENYYEQLKIRPDASSAEIEQAIDAQYNRWRKLTTHHDPKIVGEAESSLRLLETMRSTLTDPEKRAIYDAAVGIGGSIGGLSDPEALLRSLAQPVGMGITPPPPAGRKATPAAPAAPRTDAWICPRCQLANPVNTQFCGGCGYKISVNCPNCDRLMELRIPFCLHCGVDKKLVYENKKTAEKNKVLKEIAVEQKIVQTVEQISHETSIGKVPPEAKELYRNLNMGREVIQFISLLIIGIAIVVAFLNIMISLGANDPSGNIITTLISLGVAVYLYSAVKRIRERNRQVNVAVIIEEAQQKMDEAEKKLRAVEMRTYPE